MLKTRCPGCRLDLQYPPKLKGPNVRCRKCGHGFRLPAQVEKKSSLLPWLLMGGVGLVVVLLCCGGLSAVVFSRMVSHQQKVQGEMSLESFFVQRPTDGAKVRCEVAIPSRLVYTGSFGHAQQTHYEIAILTERADGKLYPSHYAYVAKDSETGHRLFSILKDGLARPMTLHLKHCRLDGSVPRPDQNDLVIVSIVSER